MRWNTEQLNRGQEGHVPGAGATGWYSSSSSPADGVDGLVEGGDFEGGSSVKSTLDDMPMAASLSATLMCWAVGEAVGRAFWGEEVTWENSSLTPVPEEGRELERELFIARLFEMTIPVAWKYCLFISFIPVLMIFEWKFVEWKMKELKMRKNCRWVHTAYRVGFAPTINNVWLSGISWHFVTHVVWKSCVESELFSKKSNEQLQITFEVNFKTQ